MNAHELHLAMIDKTRPWNEDLAMAADWSEWQDAPVPPGYDTVYGYMSRHERRVLGGMEVPLEGMAEDQERFMVAAKEKGLKAVEVPAPTVLRRLGMETAIAFPAIQLVAEAADCSSRVSWMAGIVDAYYQPKEAVQAPMTDDELISKAMEIMRKRAECPAAA